MLLRHARSMLPADATLLVDVSNTTPSQERAMRGHRPVLLSTHKHFNYRAARDRLPAVADGTPWIVLRVPHERDGQTLTAEYDADAQRFRPRVATNSPRLRYLPESLCVIDDATARPMTSPRHAACEIDDMLLRQLSAATGLPVVTNDRALGHRVARRDTPRPSQPMRRLMAATRATLLVRRGRRWVASQTRRRSPRPRSRS